MTKPAALAAALLSRLLPALPNHVSGAGITKTPGIPFFRDDRHTTPTRALYRRLLRLSTPARFLALDDNLGAGALRRGIREEWRKRKGMTSITRTRSFLESQYALLDLPSLSLSALAKGLAAKQARHDDRLRRQAQARREAEACVKPYLAGFLRPGINNPPLPQLKPQPVQLSLMIKSRVAARQRRVYQQRQLWIDEEGIKEEMAFCRRVRYREGLEEAKLFLADLRQRAKVLQGYFDKDEERKRGVYSVGMVRRVDKAKRKRQAWKRQKAEERKATVGSG